MELSRNLCAKHHGGLLRLRLYDASKILAASYNSSTGCYTSLEVEEDYSPVEVVFAEQGASWSESVDESGAVEHRVEFLLEGCRSGALDELVALSEGGVVAEMVGADGVVRLVGYSPRAGADYPLRLAKALLDSRSSRADKPSVTVLLRSLDGWASCPAEWSL